VIFADELAAGRSNYPIKPPIFCTGTFDKKVPAAPLKVLIFPFKIE
jgi:hypothetical protein